MPNIAKEKNETHLFFGLLIILVGLTRDLFFLDDYYYYLEDFHRSCMQGVLEYISGNKIIITVLSYMFLAVNALYLETLNRRFAYISFNTHLPTLLFLLISISMVPMNKLLGVQVASFLLISAINKVFATFGIRKLVFQFFDAAVFLFIAVLFYPNMIFVFVWLIVALPIIRNVRGKEILMILFGLLVPALLMFSIELLTGKPVLPMLDIRAYPTIKSTVVDSHLPNFIFLLLMGVIASIHMVLSIRKKKIKTRRFYVIFFALFVFLFLMPFTGFLSFEIVVIGAIPLSALFAHFLLNIRPRMANILYYLFIFISFASVLTDIFM